MKITGFIFDLSKGGAQGVFATVMNSFRKNGHEVDVVTLNLENAVYLDNIDKGIKVVSLNTSGAEKSLPALINYVKNHDIETAWVFGPELCVDIYWAKWLSRKDFPIIGRCINTLSVEFKYTDSLRRKYITNALLKMFFHKITYVIAQSNNMKDDLIENYHFKESQVKTINNALSKKYEEEFNNSNELERDNYFLYVGRLEKQKGLHMLLTAFSQVKDKTTQLVLLGDGSQRGSLEQLAVELGISHRVEFVNYTNQTIQYYKKAIAVVLSSYFEGFPNVLIESLSCGTPVVSFDLPSGPNEIIVQGVNGYLVEYCNVQKLAEKMELTMHNKWDYAKIKESARRYAGPTILKKYADLLKQCEMDARSQNI